MFSLQVFTQLRVPRSLFNAAILLSISTAVVVAWQYYRYHVDQSYHLLFNSAIIVLWFITSLFMGRHCYGLFKLAQPYSNKLEWFYAYINIYINLLVGEASRAVQQTATGDVQTGHPLLCPSDSCATYSWICGCTPILPTLVPTSSLLSNTGLCSLPTAPHDPMWHWICISWCRPGSVPSPETRLPLLWEMSATSISSPSHSTQNIHTPASPLSLCSYDSSRCPHGLWPGCKRMPTI